MVSVERLDFVDVPFSIRMMYIQTGSMKTDRKIKFFLYARRKIH